MNRKGYAKRASLTTTFTITTSMVFSDRKFIVVANNAESYEKHEALTEIIRKHGGEIVPWDVRADGDVSPKLVIVAPSMDYERAEEMKRFMIPTVTEDWIHACVSQGKIVPMRPYSPDPRNFMRDAIVCFSQLSKGDTDVFRAGILASGGDVSDIVTRYTTHVVAMSLDTQECQLVVHSRENNPGVGIHLVKPEWIDACMSLGIKVDDRPYLLDRPTPQDLNEDQALTTVSQHNLTGVFLLPDSPRLAVQQSMRESLGSSILDGRCFFLGGDLDLSERVDKTVKYLVETNGGRITDKLENAQVYIGKWREGSEYIEASKRRIVVGNITWLYWLMIHQKFEKPTHLLHYPEVRNGLPAMKPLKICITNYTGDARAYLQMLIQSIGATYSGKLIEKDTTHLIAAYESGQKYEAAKKWGIPVVNHLWLEDCYAYWQVTDTDSRLYTYFPPKLSMSTLVGSRNLVANVLAKFQKPDDFAVSREHHKRQAKQRAGDWLHDAMIVENEYHEKLRRGTLPEVPPADDTPKKRKMESDESKSSPVGPETPSPQPQYTRKQASPSMPEHKHGLNRKSPSPMPVATTSKAASQSGIQSQSHGHTSLNRRVMVSGVDDPPSAKALSKIGLSLVKTTPVHILVAPRFLKTSKFLQALADTEEFVDPEWLNQSLAAETLLPIDKYHLQDEQLAEAMASRAKLNGRGLFEGMSFRLDPSQRDKTATFRELVKSHKGKVVAKPGEEVINVGETISWSSFVDAIQQMDTSLFDSES